MVFHELIYQALGFPQSQILKRFGVGMGENSSGAVRERDGRNFVNIWGFSSSELMLWMNEGENWS